MQCEEVIFTSFIIGNIFIHSEMIYLIVLLKKNQTRHIRQGTMHVIVFISLSVVSQIFYEQDKGF